MRKINIHCKKRNRERQTERDRHTHTNTKELGPKSILRKLFVCCLLATVPLSLPLSLSRVSHLACFSFISLRLQCARMINERKFHFIFSARYFCPASPPLPPVRCFSCLCFELPFCSLCLAVVVSRILAAIAGASLCSSLSCFCVLLRPTPSPPSLAQRQTAATTLRTNNESALARSLAAFFLLLLLALYIK